MGIRNIIEVLPILDNCDIDDVGNGIFMTPFSCCACQEQAHGRFGISDRWHYSLDCSECGEQIVKWSAV